MRLGRVLTSKETKEYLEKGEMITYMDSSALREPRLYKCDENKDIVYSDDTINWLPSCKSIDEFKGDWVIVMID